MRPPRGYTANAKCERPTVGPLTLDTRGQAVPILPVVTDLSVVAGGSPPASASSCLCELQKALKDFCVWVVLFHSSGKIRIVVSASGCCEN